MYICFNNAFQAILGSKPQVTVVTEDANTKLNQWQTWREQINTTMECVNNLNKVVKNLPQLSIENRKRVENLNLLVNTLKVNVEMELGIEVGASSGLEPGWERAEVEGKPYYIE